MYLESSVLLTYILWRKSLVLFLKQFLNEVSTIPKYLLFALSGADTTSLYAMFTVKHLLSSGHSALFLQLHPWLFEVGWIILRLWLRDWAHISTATITQLYCIFVKGCWHFMNFLPIFVFTIFENGGLNHIILRWHFLTFL